MRRSLFRACLLFWLLAGGTAAQAACLADQSGALLPMEQLAFRDPGRALPQLQTMLERRKSAPAREVAGLNAVAADAARQLGLSRQSSIFADAGLALLPVGDVSDLAIRLRLVRALVSTNLGGIDVAIVELNRLAEVVRSRPLALGCVLRDRGWLHFRDGDNDQALDDLMRAYALLRANGSEDETMVAAGRLSMAQFSVRDYSQALILVDESIAFFRKQGARVRLATALDRRASILTAAGRFEEAQLAAEEALQVHSQVRDTVGIGLSQLRMCGVEAARGSFAVAEQWCDRAEATLRRTNGMDDNDSRTLAALRGRLLLDQGQPREAISHFDRAIAPGGAQPAYDITELHALRARAYAALGDYAAAYADQSEYLRRSSAQETLDRVRELTRERVRFETDREKQKIALLEKDGALAAERLASQARATRLLAIAGFAALLTALAFGYALLANRRHRAQLIANAERDYLTGLSNRRAIVRAGIAALKQAQHDKRKLAIALIDLDHFKQINDAHGHAVGDRLLQRFAQVSSAAIRSQARMGRYGGEEFLVIFEITELEAVMRLAENLRTAVRATSIDVDSQPVSVTLSMGVAVSSSADTQFDQLARRADLALYAAKRLGRDRVELFDAQQHDVPLVASLPVSRATTRMSP